MASTATAAQITNWHNSMQDLLFLSCTCQLTSRCRILYNSKTVRLIPSSNACVASTRSFPLSKFPYRTKTRGIVLAQAHVKRLNAQLSSAQRSCLGLRPGQNLKTKQSIRGQGTDSSAHYYLNLYTLHIQHSGTHPISKYQS